MEFSGCKCIIPPINSQILELLGHTEGWEETVEYKVLLMVNLYEDGKQKDGHVSGLGVLKMTS